jgi:hypothetical protein
MFIPTHLYPRARDTTDETVLGADKHTVYLIVGLCQFFFLCYISQHRPMLTSHFHSPCHHVHLDLLEQLAFTHERLHWPAVRCSAGEACCTAKSSAAVPHRRRRLYPSREGVYSGHGSSYRTARIAGPRLQSSRWAKCITKGASASTTPSHSLSVTMMYSIPSQSMIPFHDTRVWMFFIDDENLEVERGRHSSMG